MGTGRLQAVINRTQGKEGKRSAAKSAHDFHDSANKTLESTGYRLLFTDGLYDKNVRSSFGRNIEELLKYRKAMGDREEMPGTIQDQFWKKSNTGSVKLGSTNYDMNIKFNGKHGDLDDFTLVHEHTHNMMNYIAWRIKGENINSADYQDMYAKGIIEKQIQTAALARLQKLKLQRVVDGKERIVYPFAKVRTVEEAVNRSRMDKYALRQYDTVPKCTYKEIAPMAAEKFAQAGYDWKVLRRSSPYAYCVMQEVRKMYKDYSKK